MTIAVCILAYFVVTLAFTLIYVCYEFKISKEEWVAVIMLVLCPPIWILLCYIVRGIKKAITKKKIKKAIEERESKNV